MGAFTAVNRSVSTVIASTAATNATRAGVVPADAADAWAGSSTTATCAWWC